MILDRNARHRQAYSDRDEDAFDVVSDGEAWLSFAIVGSCTNVVALWQRSGIRHRLRKSNRQKIGGSKFVLL